MNDKEFTHLKENGIHMVDVSAKSEQNRLAISSGNIYLKKETIEKIQKSEIKKGNVLTVAQIAGIQAVKNTSDIIPLCHPLRITGIEIDFDVKPDYINCKVTVNSKGRTGVEMEAITGCSVALLTIWDMVKAVEKDSDGQYPNTHISNIEVIKKEKTN